MSGVNKTFIVGRLGKDPEIRYTTNGSAVANLSVATSEKYKDKNTGQDNEITEWHRIVAFGRLAEIIGEYLKKGSQAYFEGKLRTRKWQDQSGQDRYTTEIVVGHMQMLGSAGDSNHAIHDNHPQQASNNQQAQAKQQAPGSDDFDDDIPF